MFGANDMKSNWIENKTQGKNIQCVVIKYVLFGRILMHR